MRGLPVYVPTSFGLVMRLLKTVAFIAGKKNPAVKTFLFCFPLK